MKTLVKTASILALLAFFSSCEKSDNSNSIVLTDPIDIELNSTQTRILQSDKNFAFDFFSKIFADEDKNFMVSPFSLSMALSMTWNGAAGATQTAMKQALGLGDFSAEEANEYFKKLRDALLKTDPSTKIAIANSIWTNKNIAIKSDYLSVNKSYYSATAESVDFSDSKTVGQINQWASDNTEGLIDEVLNKTNSNDLIYLLNAIYFKGIWTSQFDKKNTSKMPFTSENGTSKDVDMMKQTEYFNYGENETLQAVQLPYGNEAFSMIVLLPQEGKKLQDVVAATQGDNYWETLQSSMYKTKVDLFLPKFKTEYNKNLNQILKDMGMEIIFTQNADFSKISDIPAMISSVDQFTYINTDEEGTEAAAVTVVTGVTSVAPSDAMVFKADKPFIYVIQENSTGVILFMGVVKSF